MRKALAMVAALAAGPLLPAAGAALPLSVGMSSQIQVGWQSTQRTATRLNRQRELGTFGEHIRPLDGSGVFAINGTPFGVDPGQESFDYGSTDRDTTTVSISQSTTFSVLGAYTSTGQATSPEPLGFFTSGNSVFQQSGTNSR
jgi:type II secretory pathway pseudopilin PulG